MKFGMKVALKSEIRVAVMNRAMDGTYSMVGEGKPKRNGWWKGKGLDVSKIGEGDMCLVFMAGITDTMHYAAAVGECDYELSAVQVEEEIEEMMKRKMD